MDPSPPCTPSSSLRFPRRRGDGPRHRGQFRRAQAFPPQARGWTAMTRPESPAHAVSPAGAGMDPDDDLHAPRSPGFPRRRGDGPHRLRVCGFARGFPPQARGWTSGVLPGRRRPVVSPAGAGMDHARKSCGSTSTSFPRRRGDGPRVRSGTHRRDVFPPQARGWTLEEEHDLGRDAVSPAGAGMDPSVTPAGPGSPSFPRRRGDGPFIFNSFGCA